MRLAALSLPILLFAACAVQPVFEPPPTITTESADGVTVHGERFFGDLGPDAPLVLLFHQGGSNGRGEYAQISGWLNAAGYRAIAWDQRVGGSLYGSSNRTAAGYTAPVGLTYCDAYPDFQAALDYVIDNRIANEVIVWGSSYSGALAFRLAAENSRTVHAVIAFSPASGKPMAGCEGRQWIDDISGPAAVFKPASEMARPGADEQQRLFEAAGIRYTVVDNGVHGSSMLVDERAGHDMSATRRSVADWLVSVAR